MGSDDLIPEAAALLTLDRILESTPAEAKDEVAVTRLVRELVRECTPELAAWRATLDDEERRALVIFAMDPFALMPWLVLTPKARAAIMRRSPGLEALVEEADEESEKPASLSARGSEVLTLVSLPHVDEWVWDLRQQTVRQMDIAATMDEEAEGMVEDLRSRMSAEDAATLDEAIARIRDAAYEAGLVAGDAAEGDEEDPLDDDGGMDETFRADFEKTMAALIPTPPETPKPPKKRRGRS